MKILNKFYPHLLAVLGFVLVSLIYFYPVIQGKALYQSDIAQYTGMAKEQNDFRAYLNALWRWKWLMLAFLVVIPTIAYVLESRKTAEYQSSALVRPETSTGFFGSA